MKGLKEPLKLLLVAAFMLLLLFLCLQPDIIGRFWRPQQYNQTLSEAMYYIRLPGKEVQCVLCPKNCILKNGERGFCNVRVNKEGVLNSMVYGRPAVMNSYPMWQRSLIYCSTKHNFMRIGTVGCNMKCKFCLTWNMSQAKPEDLSIDSFLGIDAVSGATKLAPEVFLSPEQVIQHAKKNNFRIINYTSNEPTVFYEYMLDIAKLAKKEGLINALTTCGYINKEPLQELLPYIDWVSVGLKGFTEEFYHKYCFGELQPVLETLKVLKEEKICFEISYVVIPSTNDNPDEIKNMCMWIKENLGENVPLHLYRYVPSYLLQNLPPTPISTLHAAKKIANEVGLNCVYIYYNVDSSHPTVEEKLYCPKCGQLILHRAEDGSLAENNTENGKCSFCGHKFLFAIDE